MRLGQNRTPKDVSLLREYDWHQIVIDVGAVHNIYNGFITFKC